MTKRDDEVKIAGNYSRESSAEEIAAAVDLSGKLAVITGGSVGLGRETARVLAKAGAEVFITGRREALLADAARDLAASGARVRYRAVDQMSVASVDQLADEVLELGRPVHMLIANAGVMAPPLSRSELGIESQFMTNVVAHAILLSRLTPVMANAEDARFVSLSSTGHHLSPVIFDDINFERREYDSFEAYGQSKTGSALLAVKADTALGAKGVSAFAVHPGMIETELGRHSGGADARKNAERRMGKEKADKWFALFKDVPRGASTSVLAATDPGLRGKGPLYLEDNALAVPIDEPNRLHGVLDYATDRANADRMWDAIERMIGRPLPL